VAIPADLDLHKGAWFAAEKHFKEVHGLSLDKSTKDPMRLCFVSYDPELATSDQFEPIPVNAAPELPRQKVNKAVQIVARGSQDLPPPSADEIAEMLRCIPPRPDYETWLKIASAVWSVLPMAEGARLLHEWSPEEREGEYAAKHKARLKQVSVGSLIHIAKEHGYKTPTSKAGKETLPAMSSLPKIYYAGKGGYAIETHGKYIPLSSSDAVEEHLYPYLGPKGDYADALCNIRLNNYVSYIGPVAGHRPGIHTAPDMETPFLVTTGPKIIQGAPGDFPFIDGFLTEICWERSKSPPLLDGAGKPSGISWQPKGDRCPLPLLSVLKGAVKALRLSLCVYSLVGAPRMH
jgi:hypothetical protein